MANQTITSNTNYDDASISGLANGENVACNGGVLTIDSDTRHAQQSAVVGSMDVSATLGGGILIDGTKVWQIEFDARTGNVPTLGTVGTQNCTGGTSGATGEFLGVWATYPAAPLTAGTAIPASGLVKFRSKVGTFLDNEVVTLPGGATVTINSATGGRRSWIEVAAEVNNNPNIPRLGSLVVQGDWFELGTTNGADDQTFDIPVLDSLPAFWMETSVGSGVYEKWLNAGCRWGTTTQFVATDVRGKYFGQWREQAATATSGSAVVTMASTAGFNVKAPVQNTNTNTASILADGTSINSIVTNTSVTLTANATASGAITFRSIDSKVTIARRASNTCGFKPDSGLRVRIPNVWLSNAVSANWANNVLHATVSSRYEIQASAGGVIQLSNCVCNWYINTPNCYELIVSNFAQGCAGSALFFIGNSPTRNIITNAAWGGEGLLSNNVVGLSNGFAGATFTDCRATRMWAGDTNSSVTFSVNDCVGVVLTDVQFEQFETSTGGVTHGSSDKRGIALTRVSDVTMTRCTCIGAEFYLSDVSGVVVTDASWADCLVGTTQVTNKLSVLVANSFSSGILWDGLTWFGGLSDINCYDYIFVLSSQCYDNRFRNIGTPASPLPAGTNKIEGIANVSQSVDNEFNRIYISDHRSTLFSNSASTYRTVADNCWGGAATGGYFPGNDTRLRGVREAMFITGQNSFYGSHWADMFTGTTTGRLVIAGNEISNAATSAAQCYITAGTPKFTGNGNISMPAIGDQIVWEMDYLAIGYTAFANIDPTITGTLATNIDLEFQWTLNGTWSGTWLALTGANLSGIGAINPATGIKLKVRATTVTADPTNAITFIRIDLVTDATSQLEVYPFKTDANGHIPDTTADCRVQIYNVTTATEVYNAVPGVVNWSYDYYNGTGISADDEVRVRIACIGKNLFQSNAVASSTGFSVLGEMTDDDIYTNIGIDGSTVTKFTADYIDGEVDLNVASNFSMAEFYAWWCYNRTTEQGLRLFAGAITAEDAANIRNNTSVLPLNWDNLTSTNVHQTDNIRFYREDLAYPVIEPTTGSGGIDIVWREKVYVAPSVDYSALATQASLDLVKAKTDNLPSDPADQSILAAAIAAIPTTPLLAASYVAPLDATATQAAAAAALTAYDGPTKAELDAAVAPLALEATVATHADAVEIATGVEKASRLKPYTSSI